jgi:hypothetical protein
VALAVPGVAHAQLVATVTDAAVISLTMSGVPVTHLDPGEYTIDVDDSTLSHNFHLLGPGVDEMTPISGTETTTWTVTFGDGYFIFHCDVHPTSMFGAFTVGNVLSVDKAGTGQGTVTSSPAGVNCGSTCDVAFPAGGSVTLTATAATGSTFAGWNGEGCTGTDTCTVMVSGARVVTATFTSSGGGPGPPGTGPPATVSRVSVSKVHKVRYVTIMLDVTRAATVKIVIVRGAKKLVSASRSLAVGHRTIKIKVPKKPPKGQASVKLTLKDVASGQSFVVKKNVKLPKP